METKVQTLYEFEGDTSTGELSFGVGEIIVVTNKEVDDGWWEGRKSDGTIGLFPQSYVQEESAMALSQDPFQQSNGENAFTSDPFQMGDLGSFSDPFQQGENGGTSLMQDSQSQGDLGSFSDPFQQTENGGTSLMQDSQPQVKNDPSLLGDIFGGLPQPPPITELAAGNPYEAGEYEDLTTQSVDNSNQQTPTDLVDDENYIDVTADGWSSTPVSPSSPAKQTVPSQRSSSQSSDAGATTLKRSSTVKIPKTLFSTFTKTAGASYVLGESKVNVANEKKSQIVLGTDGPIWENSPGIFSCTITNPLKQTKYRIKNYIAYEVSSTNTKKSVVRRYKHFDWLYEQLLRKYGVVIAVPPPPGKQITGRYEEEFVESRRAQLQCWLSRMGLHPVVSQSDVLQHFLTYFKSEKEWKAGKRRSEKDGVVGSAFLDTLETPSKPLDFNVSDLTLESSAKFSRVMDDSCKQLIAVGSEQVRSSLVRQKESEKLGQAFQSLSDAFALDGREVSTVLTQAIKKTGTCYEAIGAMHRDQVHCDWNPFLTGLNEYKAVLSTFPSILANQKSAMDKNKEIQRLHGENKVSQEEMKNASLRTEKISYAVQAEMNHFQHYRVGDFIGYMQDFLQQQIEFHRKVVTKLEETLTDYKMMSEQ